MFYAKKASQENINFDDSPSKNCWRNKDKDRGGTRNRTHDRFFEGPKEVKSMIIAPSLFYFGGIKAALDTWFIESLRTRDSGREAHFDTRKIGWKERGDRGLRA